MSTTYFETDETDDNLDNSEEMFERSASDPDFEDVTRIDKQAKADYANQKNISIRAIAVGVGVGGLMCFSNMYFGLQTGWITMGSLQSTLLGFIFFKLLAAKIPYFRDFGPLENVILQTTSVATATMPLAGGFVGILPALGMLTTDDNPGGPIRLDWYALLLWCFALAFFGVFFAVPLRRQTILKEKLKFPSGTATAEMIKVLHRIEDSDEIRLNADETPTNSLLPHSHQHLDHSWKQKWTVFMWTFAASAFLTLLGYFVPIFKNFPIFTWFGAPLLTSWNWTLTPSLSYIAQGMIMGPKTGLSMLLGTIVGWVWLGPMANALGWAPGSVNDWETGPKGWILWIALSILLAESLASLLILVIKSIKNYEEKVYEEIEDPAPESEQVPRSWWLGGLLMSSVTCMVILIPLFDMPVYEPFIAVIVALLVSVLAVRALGSTDINPTSGVGKLSQLLFAVVAPGNIVSNIVAGAVAEAGAQQAGDLMQDLKTGHLLRASPRAQFYGQLIGSACSIFFTVAAYLLYTNAYEIPSNEFPVPTAGVWIDMARLINGGIIAQNVTAFCVVGALLAACLPVIETLFPDKADYLPSGVAFAVAMYVTPNWTLPRVIGSLIQFFWIRKNPTSHEKYMIVAASGFVLGEGIIAILNAVMKTSQVPVLSCIGCDPGFCGGCP